MATLSNRGKLVIQNENFEVHQKKAAVDGKMKHSKAATNKGKAAGTRKPLGDVTNKKSFHPEISTKKTSAPHEELNVGGEGFLHDHSKCIKAQQTASKSYFLDLVLPRYDSLVLAESLEAERAKADLHSPRCYPELEEISMPEFSELPMFSTPLNSPMSSPMRWNSLLHFEPGFWLCYFWVGERHEGWHQSNEWTEP
ncbi:hypothetical protein Nepgr_015196 [Nepenthes gracilis]|uniref:Protein PATRONUS 2 n=1 Tax=Nepenthes gracilis TaxID=150966 RepID=A0AAD3SKL9_NEPGR|nr:hypothetical protein Nepgr_015196 [Nepenthes gracilis]